MEKKTAHMSAAEIREQRLKVLYRILPIVSLLLLVALWLLASSGANSNFPTPQAVWDRTVRLFTNPVKKLTLVGHALVSLRRIGLALVFDGLLVSPLAYCWDGAPGPVPSLALYSTPSVPSLR